MHLAESKITPDGSFVMDLLPEYRKVRDVRWKLNR